MPFKTGAWGEQEKKRAIKRKVYFKQRYYALKKAGLWKSNGYPKPKNDIDPKFYRMGELEALKILEGAIDKNKIGTGQYDIKWMGYKIEVKSSNRVPVQHSKTFRWKFCLTQRGKVNFFLLLCFLDDCLKYTFLIPDKELGEIKHLSIASSNIPRFGKFLIK